MSTNLDMRLSPSDRRASFDQVHRVRSAHMKHSPLCRSCYLRSAYGILCSALPGTCYQQYICCECLFYDKCLSRAICSTDFRLELACARLNLSVPPDPVFPELGEPIALASLRWVYHSIVATDSFDRTPCRGRPASIVSRALGHSMTDLFISKG